MEVTFKLLKLKLFSWKIHDRKPQTYIDNWHLLYLISQLSVTYFLISLAWQKKKKNFERVLGWLFQRTSGKGWKSLAILLELG